MLIFATLVGKIILRLLRLAGRRGSALPGLIVEKLYPGYLAKTLGQLPRGVIVVIGTNGKTTTTKIITELLQAQGLSVLSNPTGSNFVRGIVASVVGMAHFNGRLDYDIAVIEQDEAWAVHFVRQVRPRGVVVLNVMRDQMDRFGEIDTTANLLAKTVAAATDWLVLNSNDPRVAQLAEAAPRKPITWFGHSPGLFKHYLSDDQHHAARPEFYQAARPQVCLQAFGASRLDFVVDGRPKTVVSQLDGSHNAINMMAALAAVWAVLPNANLDAVIQQAGAIQPAFGRGEWLKLNSGARLRLQLVKNPAGFTHSLRLLNEAAYERVGLAINDNYADGRDVSWLWDVEYQPVSQSRGQVLCGGSRALDMAVRLKYDGIASQAQTNPRLFLDQLVHDLVPDQQVIIFCTYTAMLSLRAQLKKQYKDQLDGGL